MTKQEFFDFVSHNLVILDGATGSNLCKMGMKAGSCTEKWILEHREDAAQLQKSYVEAGTKILYAPTFNANRIALSEYGLADQMEQIISDLVSLSREAAGGKALVAGDMTMTGCQLEPFGSMKFEDLILIYKEQIQCLCRAGVDLLVIETMMSLQETRAAVIAAREVCELPVMVSLTFNESEKTMYGDDPAAAVVVLQSLGADAVGANCSAGPDSMCTIVSQMKEYADVPVIVKPNAGYPKLDRSGNTVYSMDKERFAAACRELVKTGADLIGGCCGTTPDYIRELVRVADSLKVPRHLRQRNMCLATERRVFTVPSDGVMSVMEILTPERSKILQRELRMGNFDTLLDCAEDQAECGGVVLCICMEAEGSDEMQLLVQAVCELSDSVKMPLCFETSNPEALEAVLRIYPGRALVYKAVAGPVIKKRLDWVVQKYGALIVEYAQELQKPEGESKAHIRILRVPGENIAAGAGKALVMSEK